MHRYTLHFIFILLATAISLLLVAVLIQLVGYDPFEVFRNVWQGAFNSTLRVAGVLNFWVPLTLVATGLIMTFRAGIWNIGVEGQIMFGAVFASGIAIFLPSPAIIRIPVAMIAAVIGGIFWALLVGILKIRLGVHEIFGGVALNAIADAVTNYLVASLWAPPNGNAVDVGLFDEAARLQTFSPNFPVNISMTIITLTIVVISIVVLRGTRWALELKAVGKNPHSALLLGIPMERTSLSALVFCGALAGLVGAYRVLFTYGTLRSHVSGGIGFLGILIVVLVSMQTLWVPFVTFVFAALLFGSTHLRVSLGLDTSLIKTFQGSLVLLLILGNGLRVRLAEWIAKSNFI